MIKLEFEGLENFPPKLDVDLVSEAADKAGREVMRRKGLPRGQNLVGAQTAAVEAAAEELDRQLHE